jgi:hypothetical protein
MAIDKQQTARGRAVAVRLVNGGPVVFGAVPECLACAPCCLWLGGGDTEQAET